MSINISAAEVTNLYLYGQSTTPANLADVSVLSHQAPSPLSFDVDQYMTLGAGRFGKPSQFAMINWFMENSVLGEIGVETRYTLAELVSLTGASLRVRVTQAFYDDGSDDVVQRTYIWNTTHFILEDATFVMGADGTRWIENLKILPEVEDFDFRGGWVSELASYALVTVTVHLISALFARNFDGLGKSVLVCDEISGCVSYSNRSFHWVVSGG